MPDTWPGFPDPNPVCGQDFCDRCGQCLACQGCRPCYPPGGSPQHAHVIGLEVRYAFPLPSGKPCGQRRPTRTDRIDAWYGRYIREG